MPQHTSSEVNGYNCRKYLKNTKIKRGTGDKIKNNYVISTGHNIQWDHFNILATGKSDFQCKILKKLFWSDKLKLSLNENIGIEKLFLY